MIEINIFTQKKILIIANFDPNRICGQTIHLNYLKQHFEKQNSVKLQTTATLKEIMEADVIWFRTEKGFLKFLLLCLLFRKAIVYDMSSFPWLELKTTNRSWLRINTSRYIFKFAAKVAQIRVLSQAMKDYLLEHFDINSEKIFVFYIPVELDSNIPRIRTNSQVHFIYVGSDRAWQGLPKLIKAFNQIESEPDFVLHCYGIKKQNTKNIIFHELVSHDQLLSIISKDIDVIVVPRERNDITEAVMPIKYAEAIHQGKYILATDLKVLHEIANSKVIFIKNNRVKTLIDGIMAFRSIIFRD